MIPPDPTAASVRAPESANGPDRWVTVRNGMPPFRPYVRGARRPAWMLAALGPEMARLAAGARRNGARS